LALHIPPTWQRNAMQRPHLRPCSQSRIGEKQQDVHWRPRGTTDVICSKRPFPSPEIARAMQGPWLLQECAAGSRRGSRRRAYSSVRIDACVVGCSVVGGGEVVVRGLERWVCCVVLGEGVVCGWL
jgi:hypothetical protein